MKNTTINIEEAIQTINKQNKRIEELCLEMERLNKRIITLEETIRIANNNVLKDIAMIKTHEMVKQEIVQRLFETSKMLEKGSESNE